jgi:hypothetical protein
MGSLGTAEVCSPGVRAVGCACTGSFKSGFVELDPGAEMVRQRSEDDRYVSKTPYMICNLVVTLSNVMSVLLVTC